MFKPAMSTLGVLFWGVSLFAQNPPALPNDVKDFYLKLNDRFQGLIQNLQTPDEISLTSKLLKSLLTSFHKKELSKNAQLKELDLTLEIKNKLFSLLKKDIKELKETDPITLEKLELAIEKSGRLPKDDPNKISEEEKVKIIGLILTHAEKSITGQKETEAAIEGLIKKFQEDPLFEETKKSDKKGLDLLSELIQRGIANPEKLEALLGPIQQQIFTFEKSKLSPIQQANIPSFTEALSNINRLFPQAPDFPGRGLALNPYRGETGANPLISGGRFGVPRGGSIPIGMTSPTPRVQDTPDLKICTDEIRSKKFNVELQLGNSLCASTPIAKDPKKTLENFRRDPKAQCEVNLASALHCIEGKVGLVGRTIMTNMGNLATPAKVVQIGSADRISGPSVQNGNPDLIVLSVEVPCESALRLQVARVPSPDEIQELAGQDTFPIVMQQNSTINASIQGSNKATIAASGRFDTDSNGNLGNYIRFNSNSRFNSSSGLDVGPQLSSKGLSFDSKRINSGDSGGAALTCKFKKDDKSTIEDILFVGAISHINVTHNQDEGKEGGIASGNSLLNLSRLFYPASTDGHRFADNNRQDSSTQNNKTH